MDITNYKQTLTDFKNRLIPFRFSEDAHTQRTNNRLENHIKKLLQENIVDVSFYEKVCYFHCMNADEFYRSDVVDYDWINDKLQKQ